MILQSAAVKDCIPVHCAVVIEGKPENLHIRRGDFFVTLTHSGLVERFKVTPN